jgi:NTP pyrophosphatase (non-canonical NTP hydrolase)
MSRDKILGLFNTDPDTIRAALEGSDQATSADKKLLALTIGVGQLAAFIRDDGWSRNHLRRVFGFCAGWLLALGEKNALMKISAERDRQEKLFRIEKKLHFTCASRIPDATRKLRVLVEELGEVANAIDQLEIAESRESLALKEWRLELRVEITQVAAVAVAWLESYEVKP